MKKNFDRWDGLIVAGILCVCGGIYIYEPPLALMAFGAFIAAIGVKFG
jgi:hypothetical protein